MLSTDGGSANALYIWTVPIATDNVNVTVLDASHQPNTYFMMGMTEVTYKAIDEAGNDDTCTFTVTVNGKKSGSIKSFT